MKNIKTKPYNFLLEMLVVIILFTFCCVIFVELFALSKEKSNKAIIMANALNDVETYASLIKNNDEVDEVYKTDDYTITINKLGDAYNIIATYKDGEEIININVTSLGGAHEE